MAAAAAVVVAEAVRGDAEALLGSAVKTTARALRVLPPILLQPLLLLPPQPLPLPPHLHRLHLLLFFRLLLLPQQPQPLYFSEGRESLLAVLLLLLRWRRLPSLPLSVL